MLLSSKEVDLSSGLRRVARFISSMLMTDIVSSLQACGENLKNFFFLD